MCLDEMNTGSKTETLKMLAEKDSGAPKLSPGSPADQRVVEGQEAVFECLVESKESGEGPNPTRLIPPHIKWLKRVDSHELSRTDYKDRLLPVENGHHHVVVLQVKLNCPNGM